jgi:FtsP/CotA-like multicopper oxidase with cupredoxin domain
MFNLMFNAAIFSSSLTNTFDTFNRLVNAAADFSYAVSVDGHTLQLLALDGHDVVPINVDSIIVHPGESADFEIVPDDVDLLPSSPNASIVVIECVITKSACDFSS